MLRKLILNRLGAFERDFGYDASYVRDVLETDLGAFLKLARIQRTFRYRHAVPLDAWFAAGIAATQAQDCGPCTQLGVTMAEREGVAPETLRAVLQRDESAMNTDVRLSVSFVRAVLARDPRADALRDEVLSRWGRRGLLTLAFATVAGTFYPTLKYALGYGRACTRVVVAGTPVAAAAAHAIPAGAVA